MENKNCFNVAIKHEKLKLHTKYICSISLGIVALSIIAAGYSNNEFVSQISFASTISSIILSVIAIIMTIIGEEKTDNTKNKLVDISENLSGIVDNIDEATKKLKDFSEIDQKLNKMDDIITKLDRLDERVLTKDDFSSSAFLNTQSPQSIAIDSSVDLIKVYENIIKDSDPREILLTSTFYFVYRALEKKTTIKPEDFNNYLNSTFKLQEEEPNIIWGIYYTFRNNGVLQDEKFENNILEKMQNAKLNNYKNKTDLYIDKLEDN